MTSDQQDTAATPAIITTNHQSPHHHPCTAPLSRTVDRVVPGCNSFAFLFRCDKAALLIIAAEIKRMFFGGHCSRPGGCGAYGTGTRCNEPRIE
jgi:hypothetical protein